MLDSAFLAAEGALAETMGQRPAKERVLVSRGLEDAGWGFGDGAVVDGAFGVFVEESGPAVGVVVVGPSPVGGGNAAERRDSVAIDVTPCANIGE